MITTNIIQRETEQLARSGDETMIVESVEKMLANLTTGALSATVLKRCDDA